MRESTSRTLLGRRDESLTHEDHFTSPWRHSRKHTGPQGHDGEKHLAALERICLESKDSEGEESWGKCENIRGQVYFVEIDPTDKCFHVYWLIQGLAFNKAADAINRGLAWVFGGI